MTRAEPAVSEASEAMIEPTPLPRRGRADELASVAAFLRSSGASFVTDCDIQVDDGVRAALGLWRAAAAP